MAHDFRRAHHLPNVRGDAGTADPYDLPRQRRGKTPQMHGRYPDFDVLAEADAWDEPTRKVVLARVDDVPARRFFTVAEAATLTRVLRRRAGPGFRASDPSDRVRGREAMRPGRPRATATPACRDDGDTWRLVARGLDDAAGGGDGAYARASAEQREQIVDAFAAGEVCGGAWEHLDVSRAWSVVMRDALRRVLRAPMGLERDRLRRAGLPTRLRPDGRRSERGLGGRRGDRPRSRART